jgi:L-fuculose-phosphate aldolase
MPKTDKELRADVVQVGKLVYQKGWVAANDGNISVRLDQDRVLCTPTGVSKGMMQEEDLIIVDMQGNKIEGHKSETSEIGLHLTVYKLRPDVRSVLHAHPPVATGFATAGRALNLALLPEIVIGLGCVPLAEYGLPGTVELIEPMLPYIPNYDAILMGNHGAVCYGEDVFKAFFRMEMLEHFARITLVAELLGGPKALPRAEVEKLLKARPRYGITSHGDPGPVRFVCAGESGEQPERLTLTRKELLAIVEEVLKEHGLA